MIAKRKRNEKEEKIGARFENQDASKLFSFEQNIKEQREQEEHERP
jgi:hypothetical protein